MAEERDPRMKDMFGTIMKVVLPLAGGFAAARSQPIARGLIVGSELMQNMNEDEYRRQYASDRREQSKQEMDMRMKEFEMRKTENYRQDTNRATAQKAADLVSTRAREIAGSEGAATLTEEGKKFGLQMGGVSETESGFLPNEDQIAYAKSVEGLVNPENAQNISENIYKAGLPKKSERVERPVSIRRGGKNVWVDPNEAVGQEPGYGPPDQPQPEKKTTPKMGTRYIKGTPASKDQMGQVIPAIPETWIPFYGDYEGTPVGSEAEARAAAKTMQREIESPGAVKPAGNPSAAGAGAATAKAEPAAGGGDPLDEVGERMWSKSEGAWFVPLRNGKWRKIPGDAPPQPIPTGTPTQKSVVQSPPGQLNAGRRKDL
jgi:hypothetical protein